MQKVAPSTPATAPTPSRSARRKSIPGREYRMFQGSFLPAPLRHRPAHPVPDFRRVGRIWNPHSSGLAFDGKHDRPERRVAIAAQRLPYGRVHYDLLSVAQECGLPTITKGHKKDMRLLILRGGPFTRKNARRSWNIAPPTASRSG